MNGTSRLLTPYNHLSGMPRRCCVTLLLSPRWHQVSEASGRSVQHNLWYLSIMQHLDKADKTSKTRHDTTRLPCLLVRIDDVASLRARQLLSEDMPATTRLLDMAERREEVVEEAPWHESFDPHGWGDTPESARSRRLLANRCLSSSPDSTVTYFSHDYYQRISEHDDTTNT